MNQPASSGRRGRWAACLIAACWACLPVASPALVLNADRHQSTDGVVQLSWALDGRPVVLQRSADPSFLAPKTLYRGTDSASLRTGLPNGDYYFRLRAADQPGVWSDPVEVSVRHHGPLRTWGLFGLGALVFLSVIGLILGGTAREKRRD